jgi:hypothetical protein
MLFDMALSLVSGNVKYAISNSSSRKVCSGKYATHLPDPAKAADAIIQRAKREMN